MKRSLLIALCVVMCSSMAFAQAGSIGVYADVGATMCEVNDFPGLVPVYVFHLWTTGATASQFMLQSNCNTMVFLGETYSFSTVIGNTQSGISIAYGGCFVHPILLVSINYFGQGLTQPCCYLSVVADPAAPTGQIEAVDCALPNPNKMFPTGGQLIINPTPPDCTCAWPVEETTWGGVKALYQ